MVKKLVRDNNSRCFMTYDRSLVYMPHAQAGVARVFDKKGGRRLLISYCTPVAWITDDGYIGCDGLYSMTTRKHISAFAREFGFTYHDFKRAYLKGVEYNPITGEEIKLL